MFSTALRSPYWNSLRAAATRRRISDYEKEKTHRPTVVVPIIDHAGRPLVVRHSARGEWGLIQGHIEPTDAHPLAAGLREAYEEGGVTNAAIDGLFPYLGERGVEFTGPQTFFTGFTKGGYYVMVGLKLKPGADVSPTPHAGQPAELSERKWCSSLDDAVRILIEQPGVSRMTPRLVEKIHNVLIPALENIYQPEAKHLVEVLNPIT